MAEREALSVVGFPSRFDVTVTAPRLSDPARGIGSGLSTAEAGLRLRYEFTREFAPYIGIERAYRLGRPADR